MDKDRKIEQLEKDLERTRKMVDITAYYWGSLTVKKDKYWKNIRIELNRCRNKKDFKFLGEQYIEELEDKIKELETELYFCNRNNRIGEIVDG